MPIRSRATLVLAGALLAATDAAAVRLPVRSYTTTEGLPRDDVERVVLDSRGFLWIATHEGLSRFDGYRFVNYGAADGLPSDETLDVVETRAGAYWVATDRGACRFDPAAPRRPGAGPIFAAVPVAQRSSDDAVGAVRTVVDDGAGGAWLGTGSGLVHLRPTGDGWSAERVDLGVGAAAFLDDQVNAIVTDARGRIWVATRGLGLFRQRERGGWDQWTAVDGLPSANVHTLLLDPDGHVWAGQGGGIVRIAVDAAAHTPPELVLTRASGLLSEDVRALAFAGPGGRRLFVGTLQGVQEVIRGEGPTRLVPVDVAPANATLMVASLAADHDHGLWIGTLGSGVLYLDLEGATRYGVEDGLVSTRFVALLDTDEGLASVNVVDQYDALVVHTLVGGRFVPARLALDSPVGGWGWSQFAVQDGDGRWWVPTAHGVFRFPKVARLADLAHVRPSLAVSARTGLPQDEIFRLWRDSRGDIWISAYGLARVRHDTGGLDVFRDEPAFVPPRLPSAFAEDRGGAVWIGDYAGGVVRFDGTAFARFGTADGVPPGTIEALHVDRRGRLWVGTAEGGAARVDDPTARPPRFVPFGPAQGLASREVSAIAEDAEGRIYLAGGRGVDRLDADDRRLERITTADGLAGGSIHLATATRDGAIWFASTLGLSRYVPSAPRAAPPPAVRFFDVRVAGEPVAISPVGVTSVERLVLDPPRRRVDVEYAAVDASGGLRIAYQRRLVGGDETWSAASGARAAELSNLASGRYRFEVRAVAPDGRTGPVAAIAFVVRPPLWRRPEIAGAALVIAALAGAWAHRRRVARLLELERVRTRIATDLHDDLGASLSKIAITSEVVSAQLPGGPGSARERVSSIAATAREMVESLGDIVWTVDPRLDRLSDLVGRMRLFGEELLLPSSIAFELSAPDSAADRPLDPGLRRGLYLAFKEALHNAARHARPNRVDARLEIDGGHVTLSVRDDGAGFDPASVRRGHGLDGLVSRARGLGGTCSIRSAPGSGTEITLRAPWRAP